MHVGARLGCAWVLTLSIVCAPAPSAGSPSLVGGGGIDYSQGSGGESTRGVLAIVGSSVGSGNATLAFVRYRDSATGDGLGWIGAVRAPLARGHGLAASAARFVGDDSLRSWRVKVGPVLELPSGGTAGVYYTHAQDDAGARADAAAAELSLPLSARFTGRANGAGAFVRTYNPGDRVVLTAEPFYGQNVFRSWADDRGVTLSTATSVSLTIISPSMG